MQGYVLPWDPVIQLRLPDSQAHGSEDIIFLLLFYVTGIIRGKIIFLSSQVPSWRRIKRQSPMLKKYSFPFLNPILMSSSYWVQDTI